MKIFKVAVMETYRKEVFVQANNEREAHQRASDAWHNTEFILTPEDDFEGVEFLVLDNGQNSENFTGEFIEGFDYGLGREDGQE